MRPNSRAPPAAASRMHLVRVLPVADDLLHRRRGPSARGGRRRRRSPRLVGDDGVAVAPPELDRNAAARDRADARDRASRRVRVRRLARRAAELDPRQRGQSSSPGVSAIRGSGRPCRHRVERGDAREPVAAPRGEQQRPPARPCCRRSRRRGAGRARATGSAFRASAGIRARSSIWPRVAPRVERQPPSLAVGEMTANGPRAGRSPQKRRLYAPLDAAAVRRDHERDRRMAARPVPRRQHDVRRRRRARVRAVGERQRCGRPRRAGEAASDAWPRRHRRGNASSRPTRGSPRRFLAGRHQARAVLDDRARVHDAAYSPCTQSSHWLKYPPGGFPAVSSMRCRRGRTLPSVGSGRGHPRAPCTYPSQGRLRICLPCGLLVGPRRQRAALCGGSPRGGGGRNVALPLVERSLWPAIRRVRGPACSRFCPRTAGLGVAAPPTGLVGEGAAPRRRRPSESATCAVATERDGPSRSASRLPRRSRVSSAASSRPVPSASRARRGSRAAPRAPSPTRGRPRWHVAARAPPPSGRPRGARCRRSARRARTRQPRAEVVKDLGRRLDRARDSANDPCIAWRAESELTRPRARDGGVLEALEELAAADAAAGAGSAH